MLYLKKNNSVSPENDVEVHNFRYKQWIFRKTETRKFQILKYYSKAIIANVGHVFSDKKFSLTMMMIPIKRLVNIKCPRNINTTVNHWLPGKFASSLR